MSWVYQWSSQFIGGYPFLKAAKLRRGFGRPAALAISASIVRMRANRSAAEPYSTLLPS